MLKEHPWPAALALPEMHWPFHLARGMAAVTTSRGIEDRSLQNQMLTLAQSHAFQGHFHGWDKALQSGTLSLILVWNEASGTEASGSSHHILCDS